MVSQRDALIAAINTRGTTIEQMASMDPQLPGISNEVWEKAGILSNCCKLEILSHIPYDVFQRDYNDADRMLPPDFDTEAIVCDSVQSKETLDTPLVYRTIGTNVQYSS